MQVSPSVGVTLRGLNVNNRAGGVGYRTVELRGWWEQSESTGQVVQRPASPGGWYTDAYATGKRIVHRGSIESKSHAASYSMLMDLLDAVSLGDPAPLAVTDLNTTFHLPVRQEGRPVVEWVTDTLVTFDIQLQSGEYRLLSGDGSAATYTRTVALPYTEGGRVRPYTLPAPINAVVISGSVELTDPGQMASTPSVVVEFSGPVLRPSIRSGVTGRQMYFDIELESGQTLVVDMDRHTVRLNGVSRSGTRRGRWLDPVPGDVLYFDADTYNPDARMTVSWHDARK